MSNKLIATLVSLLLVFSLGSFYAEAQGGVFNVFRQYKEVNNLSLTVPTVVEVPFDNDNFERPFFAVLNKDTNEFEASYFRTRTTENLIPISVEVDDMPNAEALRMVDDNLFTYANFSLPGDIQETVTVTLRGNRTITSSSLSVLLGNHVALPNTIKITTGGLGSNENIVVATKNMNSQRILFPRTSASVWNITFTYSQPLRISELSLNQENAKSVSTTGLRFLAKPDNSYRIYFDADRYTAIDTEEAPNLTNNEGVLRLGSIPSQNNPEYIEADIDGDGIPDRTDNCVNLANADQADIDNNNRGDACDDWDRDGVLNSKDNCPNDTNRAQADEDGDGIGDECDGEESRITEKYSWLPWVGMSVAAAVILGLFIAMAKSMRKENKINTDDSKPDKEQ
ncbi:MAG: thrombospondin type 3 repeat-containing protein [Candidatus Spechtbacterales bacterium]|nr:thrombospondin type 3 repeat-containing protein [Candidatus Spechtbacterales bacterium]